MSDPGAGGREGAFFFSFSFLLLELHRIVSCCQSKYLTYYSATCCAVSSRASESEEQTNESSRFFFPLLFALFAWSFMSGFAVVRSNDTHCT